MLRCVRNHRSRPLMIPGMFIEVIEVYSGCFLGVLTLSICSNGYCCSFVRRNQEVCTLTFSGRECPPTCLSFHPQVYAKVPKHIVIFGHALAMAALTRGRYEAFFLLDYWVCYKRHHSCTCPTCSHIATMCTINLY